MSYDELKVIEAARFLNSIVFGAAEGTNGSDAVAAARVPDAVGRAAGSGRWVVVDRSAA